MEAIESPVDSGDRLTFTLFIAAALHGLLIFGIGFSALSETRTPPTFEVTLATHKSAVAPTDAEYQAQFNQEASGTEAENKEITTDSLAPFADTRVRETNPLPEVRKREVSEASQQRLHTSSDADFTITQRRNPDEDPSQEARDGAEKDTPLLNPEIANLRAKLAQQRQEYAKRPRVRRLTSVGTVQAADAEYLDRWRQKVESVGSANFPEAAVRDGIIGKLRLLAVIKSDGTIVSVELLQSSGHTILDNAAMQIVHLAAPFSPFPPEIAKDWDHMEIIRTWHFDITGLSTSVN